MFVKVRKKQIIATLRQPNVVLVNLWLFKFHPKASLLGFSVYEVVRVAVSRVVRLYYTPGPFKTNQVFD